MRNATPSRNWTNKFVKEFCASGGHMGEVTIKTAVTYGNELYTLGATPKVAGRAAYDAYQKLARLRDKAAGLTHEG